MKPISLKFSFFGSYKKEQFIDFKKLYNYGLFLIHGKTGAGKTVVLDAICYALYGESSGGKRGNFSYMRSNFATEKDITFVEFIFENNNKIYKFERSIKQISKRDKTFDFKEEQNAFVLENNQFVQAVEKPLFKEVAKKAEEITCLNYEQFRQVVILPQGQFERFLIAPSAEKESILTTLFGTNKWQEATDFLKSELKEKKIELKSISQNIERILSENNCETILEIEEKIQNKNNIILKTERNIILLNNELQAIKITYNNEILTNENFKNLDDAYDKLKDLSLKKSKIKELESTVLNINNAIKVKPVFNNLVEIKSDFSEKEVLFENSKTKKKVLEEKKRKIKEEEYLILQKNSDYEQKKLKLYKLSELKKPYKILEKTKNSANKSKTEYNEYYAVFNNKTIQLKKLNKERSMAEFSLSKLHNDLSKLYKTKTENICGSLALTLDENAPCPVCGSTVHPQKAELHSENISDEVIEKKEAEIDLLKENLKEKNVFISELETEISTYKIKCDELFSAMNNMQFQYENLLSKTDKKIKNEAQLLLDISVLEKEISNFENEKNALSKSIKSIEDELNVTNGELNSTSFELENAKQKINKLKDEFEKLLVSTGFENESNFKTFLDIEINKNKIEKEIEEYKISKISLEKTVENLNKKLENNIRPDISKTQDLLFEKETLLSKLNEEKALISSETQALCKNYKTLKKQYEIYEKEKLFYIENETFAEKLNGTNGISLQRYVLGVMLEAVTIEANKLLSKVHEGRYKIFHTMQSSNHRLKKVGLELEVLDDNSSKKRSVNTLSGGEKFLVSLALAVGLSSVIAAKSGGVKINSLFIDEGFGSLDDSSLNDALAILSVINKSKQLIGIISHVNVLKETIPAQIFVQKNINGSNLIFNI